MNSPSARPTVRTLLTLLALPLVAVACWSPSRSMATRADAGPRPERTLAAARDLQFTETLEIRFGGPAGELVGYLVDVLEVPAGIADERAYSPGTALIQGRDFEFLGFITPNGTTYRFDDEGRAHGVGWGSRDQGISAFFGRNEAPTLITVHPGVRG